MATFNIDELFKTTVVDLNLPGIQGMESRLLKGHVQVAGSSMFYVAFAQHTDGWSKALVVQAFDHVEQRLPGAGGDEVGNGEEGGNGIQVFSRLIVND